MNKAFSRFDANADTFYGLRCTHQPSPWMGDYGWQGSIWLSHALPAWMLHHVTGTQQLSECIECQVVPACSAHGLCGKRQDGVYVVPCGRSSQAMPEKSFKELSSCEVRQAPHDRPDPGALRVCHEELSHAVFHHVHDVELVPAAGTGCSWCQPTMGPYCEPPDSMHAQNSYLLLPVPRPFKVTFPESAQPQYRRTPVAILPSVYKSPLLNHLHPCFAIQFVVCRWPGFAWWSRRVT